jgi:hypothetical protein
MVTNQSCVSMRAVDAPFIGSPGCARLLYGDRCGKQGLRERVNEGGSVLRKRQL